ncbi:glycoside hydrolase family 114 protein [Auriculariales sp. MPI-PUGE-AT-0066]|nr:glycoside hydrolase family 114 protein [Auriculariales sp. MPI-PUGE-AT-0066]
MFALPIFGFFIAAATARPSDLGPRAVTNLPANAKFDYQIGGAYTPASDVKIVTRDRSNSPVSGLYNICYVNAFQTQVAERDFWLNNSTREALIAKWNGQYLEDPEWPGEYMFNTTTAANRQALATIVEDWIKGCADKGFNAIEPDNLDTFTRSHDLISPDDNLQYAKLFTDYAHSINLAVGQKNAGEELGNLGQSIAGFDFAIAEECQANSNSTTGYDECATYTDVYGNEVLEIEYDVEAVWQEACNKRGNIISIILRDTAVSPNGLYKEC